MRNIKIIGYGNYTPKNIEKFDGEIRFRSNGEETQLDMCVKAAKKALTNAKITINEIDCIVSASAVMMQPIPCNAALIHEKIALGTDIPAMDINTTCTSFVTALDTMSYLIEANRYKNVLIVSGDIPSGGLNENQTESYSLFSDGASAFIISKSENKDQGIIASIVKTYSEGAHATEFRGGGTLFPPSKYSEETKYEYTFDMQGKTVLTLCMKKLPKLFKEFEKETGIKVEELDYVIPHQASRALPFMMKILRLGNINYVNKVAEVGNMVSASIPYVLCEMLEKKELKTGDKVMLCGTAAGLTCNILVLSI